VFLLNKRSTGALDGRAVFVSRNIFFTIVNGSEKKKKILRSSHVNRV
jgi:hypothetical protein